MWPLVLTLRIFRKFSILHSIGLFTVRPLPWDHHYRVLTIRLSFTDDIQCSPDDLTLTKFAPPRKFAWLSCTNSTQLIKSYGKIDSDNLHAQITRTKFRVFRVRINRAILYNKSHCTEMSTTYRSPNLCMGWKCRGGCRKDAGWSHG